MGSCSNHPDREGILSQGRRLCAECLGLSPIVVGGIGSNPPSGSKKITNIFWDSVKEEFVFIVEE